MNTTLIIFFALTTLLSWFILQVLDSTFLYTWIFMRTNGSLLIALFLHTSRNAARELLPILPLDNGGSSRQLWLVIALAPWFERRTFSRAGTHA